MIKRPLHQEFGPKVLAGIKVTTIRDNPWPIGKPIMLYHWSGRAYASKHADVAAVVVLGVRTIRITHREDGGMLYSYGQPMERRIHETEGFESRQQMDEWFRPLVNRGLTVTKYLMRFHLVERGAA